MALKRRAFIKRGVTFVSLTLATNHMMMQTSNAGDSVFAQASNLSDNGRMLIVVQLQGGNDGLNTVVPYNDGRYFDARPTLAVAAEDVLPLDSQFGLNPQLTQFKALFDRGKLAVVQGVGYPNPNRSHFRSTDIWETANPQTVVGTGWLGNFLDRSIATNHADELRAVSVGRSLPLTLRGQRVVVPSIASLESFQFQTNERFPEDRNAQLKAFSAIQEATSAAGDDYRSTVASTGLSALRSADAIQRAASHYSSTVDYPNNPFGKGLQLVAKLISGGLGTQIMHVTIGGFDTHSQQAKTHTELLQAVDGGLGALYEDLGQLGIADDVLLMSFSEFGRRVKENGSQGTDHGTAAPMFVLGNGAQGGLYGQQPGLGKNDLDKNGDLLFQVDFRSVYSTVLESWLGVDPADVLGQRFENLGFVGG